MASDHPPSGGDAGAAARVDDAGGDAVADDDAGAAVRAICSSGVMWTGATTGGAKHYPGRACLACHQTSAGPVAVAPGTVYPTLHEPDDCAGLAGVVVELTDGQGHVVAATTNANGNFSLSTKGLSAPYAAVVRSPDGGARASATPHADFDCNGCHTALGAKGASGRLRAP